MDIKSIIPFPGGDVKRSRAASCRPHGDPPTIPHPVILRSYFNFYRHSARSRRTQDPRTHRHSGSTHRHPMRRVRDAAPYEGNGRQDAARTETPIRKRWSRPSRCRPYVGHARWKRRRTWVINIASAEAASMTHQMMPSPPSSPVRGGSGCAGSVVALPLVDPAGAVGSAG